MSPRRRKMTPGVLVWVVRVNCFSGRVPVTVAASLGAGLLKARMAACVVMGFCLPVSFALTFPHGIKKRQKSGIGVSQSIQDVSRGDDGLAAWDKGEIRILEVIGLRCGRSAFHDNKNLVCPQSHKAEVLNPFEFMRPGFHREATRLEKFGNVRLAPAEFRVEGKDKATIGEVGQSKARFLSERIALRQGEENALLAARKFAYAKSIRFADGANCPLIGGASNDSRIHCSTQYGLAHCVARVKRFPHNAETRM